MRCPLWELHRPEIPWVQVLDVGGLEADEAGNIGSKVASEEEDWALWELETEDCGEGD